MEESMIWSMSGDAFSEIVKLLELKDVIALWTSGSLPLRRIMGPSHGVTSISLVDRQHTSTSRWPLMLGEFSGLKVFILNRGHSPLGCISLVWSHLSRMTSLRVLHLTSSDSGKIIAQRNKTGKNEQCPSLGSFFPNLRDLLISHLEEPWSMRLIPPSVTKLSLDGKNIVFPDFSLSTLSTVSNSQSVAEEDEYNSTVTHFEVTGQISPPEAVYKLLRPFRSLTHLDLTFEDPKMLSVLPTSMLSLVYRADHELKGDLADFMPKTLESLHLHILKPRTHIPSFSTLGALRQLVCDWDLTPLTLIEAYPTFPPLLTHLGFMGPIGSVQKVIIIPDHMIRLELPFLTGETIVKMENSKSMLPVSIERVEGTFFQNVAQDRLFLSWLEMCHGVVELKLKGPIRNISLPSLPSSLTHLEVSRFHFDSWAFLHGCHRLKTLVANFAGDHVPDFLIASQLPSLTSLTIHSHSQLAPKFLSILPHAQMRCLVLHSRTGTHPLSPDDLACISLMHHLKELRLVWSMTHISNEMLALLPRQLEILNFWHATPLLTSACFVYLPRFLQRFICYHSIPSVDDDLLGLPRTLRTLILGPEVPMYSSHALYLLPTTLGEFLSINARDPRRQGPNQFTINPNMDQIPDSRITSNSFTYHAHIPPATLPSHSTPPHLPIQPVLDLPIENERQEDPNNGKKTSFWTSLLRMFR